MRTVDLGEGCELEIHEIAGASSGAGPVLAVLGGVHGDELEGVTAARMLLRWLAEHAGSLRGTVRVVAVSNPPAFAARTRTSPIDGLNLARTFPGSADGSITQRIAHVLTTQVIAGADLMIDLHSAGLKYQMPVFAGYVANAPTHVRSGEATYAFGAPLVWEHEGSGPGRSMSAAEALGVPSIYVEGSGGGGLRGDEIDIYVNGLIRILRWLEMTGDDLEPPSAPLVLTGDEGDTDASLATTVDGFCITRVHSGELVARGTVLADIVDDTGTVIEQVHAPREGLVMMLRRQAEVLAGDGIAMLGPVPVSVGGSVR
jgi:predicted deacylase